MKTYLIETTERKMIVMANDKEEAMWKAFISLDNSRETIDSYYYDNYYHFANDIDKYGRFDSDRLSLVPRDVLLAIAGAKDWEDINFKGRRFVAYVLWRSECDIMSVSDTVIVM